MCWLCGVENNIENCRCCIYLSSNPQPKSTLPEWYNEKFNSGFFGAPTAYLTKVWFFDKSCFGVSMPDKHKTLLHQVRSH